MAEHRFQSNGVLVIATHDVQVDYVEFNIVLSIPADLALYNHHLLLFSAFSSQEHCQLDFLTTLALLLSSANVVIAFFTVC